MKIFLDVDGEQVDDSRELKVFTDYAKAGCQRIRYIKDGYGQV